MKSQSSTPRLRAGETRLGTLIASTSPVWPRAVATCGLDFVFPDTEHIPLDRAQLERGFAAFGRAAFKHFKRKGAC